VGLGELTSTSRRLALVGLAKNTGKTVTLGALLRELEAQGRRVGVTSVGRDGEERDAIDASIEKPRVRLAAGSLVASTDGLLRASGLERELLEQTDVRTPLGRVLLVRLRESGEVEVAGPSAAEQVRAVSDAMLAHGAEQVLIDGAVDRRAASSPQVADGLVMATGAVLARDVEQIVSQTKDAVELVQLPLLDAGSAVGARLRELAHAGVSALVGEQEEPFVLHERFVLSAQDEQVTALLDGRPAAHHLLVAGALPERFLNSLLRPLRRRERELCVVALDPTRVFLWKHGPSWYESQGVRLRAVRGIDLRALTVNPIAPRSHEFDSSDLRRALARALPRLTVLDVMAPDYR
jgi:hypothetical protein